MYKYLPEGQDVETGKPNKAKFEIDLWTNVDNSVLLKLLKCFIGPLLE